MVSTFSLFSCDKRGFPGGSVVKNLPADAGATGGVGLIPVLGRSPGEGSGNPLKYSWWDDPTDRGTWWATVHGVAKEEDTSEHPHVCDTQSLSNFSG